MINDIIKQIIINKRHFSSLPQNISEVEFSVTKFCQRIASFHTKVLFLIQYNGLPICIAKTVRDARFNNKLKSEKENQSKATKTGIFKVPAVYFESEIKGRYIYFEEVVIGDMISSQSMLDNERDIVLSIANFRVYGEVDVQEVYNRLKDYITKDHILFHLLKLVSEYKGNLKVGITHNDFARQNIIQSKNGIYLIDWERSGECPLWLIDAVSFIVKVKKIKGLEDWVNRGVPILGRYVSVDGKYVTIVYCIMCMMDNLRKNNIDNYNELVSSMTF